MLMIVEVLENHNENHGDKIIKDMAIVVAIAPFNFVSKIQFKKIIKKSPISWI